MQTLHLVFDGECGFCRRTLRVCQRVDVFNRLRFHDANDREQVLRAFPSLHDADFDHAMFLVTARGDIHRGFFAFRRLAFNSPFTWPLLVLLYFPGSARLGPRAYHYVARNRRRWGCESTVCSLPSVPLVQRSDKR